MRRTGPHEVITARRIGNTVNYTVPVFRDVALPNGQRLQSYEMYDFFSQPADTSVEFRHQVAFVSAVPTPPALGEGLSYLHQVGWRYDSFEAMPASITDFVRTEAPMWMAPPRDLEEIRQLQQP